MHQFCNCPGAKLLFIYYYIIYYSYLLYDFSAISVSTHFASEITTSSSPYGQRTRNIVPNLKERQPQKIVHCFLEYLQSLSKMELFNQKNTLHMYSPPLHFYLQLRQENVFLSESTVTEVR